MTLAELKALLAEYSSRHFRIRLPGGDDLPQSFHVTEVGRLHKTFLDCGGTLRDSVTCQLQIWVGEDFNHRIETGKMVGILNKAATLLNDDSVAVEIEYEDRVISQYTIAGHDILEDAIVLILANKHTECLAPELCGLPAITRLPALNDMKSTGCGPSGCC